MNVATPGERIGVDIGVMLANQLVASGYDVCEIDAVDDGETVHVTVSAMAPVEMSPAIQCTVGFVRD